MDKLDDLFVKQRMLQEKFENDLDGMSNSVRQQYTKDNVLGLLDETHEILREVNWKNWKKTKKDVDVDRLKEELADAFHFFINLCLAWGFSAEEIYEAYLKKNDVIVQRIHDNY